MDKGQELSCHTLDETLDLEDTVMLSGDLPKHTPTNHSYDNHSHLSFNSDQAQETIPSLKSEAFFMGITKGSTNTPTSHSISGFDDLFQKMVENISSTMF